MALVAAACSDDDASPKKVTCQYKGHEYVQGSFDCPDLDPSCFFCMCTEDGEVQFSTYTGCNNGGANFRDAETDAIADASDAGADADAEIADSATDADGD